MQETYDEHFSENRKPKRPTNNERAARCQQSGNDDVVFHPSSSSISRNMQRCKTIPFHQIKRNNEKRKEQKKIEKKESNKGERETKQ